jgi:hypothetical protein
MAACRRCPAGRRRSAAPAARPERSDDPEDPEDPSDAEDPADDLGLPARVNPKTSKATSPTATPAAPKARPKLVKRPTGCPLTMCAALLTMTRIAPSMIITAHATDRAMTGRTLLTVTVSVRTAQRSHRR